MSVRQRVSTVLVVFTLAGTVVVTHGQGLAVNRRIVRGTVLDPTRAVLAGARVTALRDGGAAALSTVFGTNGEFSLPLEPGSYTVRTVAPGFLEASQTVNLTENGYVRPEIFR